MNLTEFMILKAIRKLRIGDDILTLIKNVFVGLFLGCLFCPIGVCITM